MTIMNWLMIGWFIFSFLLALASLMASILAVIWIIYSGIQNRKAGKCFFHFFRIGEGLKYIAGTYWYHQCPGCGVREATKMRKGESPKNQRWLDGGEWDHPMNPTATPPEKKIWRRFLCRPIQFFKYTDWPYAPPV